MNINEQERIDAVNRYIKGDKPADICKIGDVHQMDFVGPRFIKGYGAIYSLHLIDVVSIRAHIEQFASKHMDNVIAFLIKY